MKIRNETPLTMAWFVCATNPPELSATFVAKGTFRIRPGGVAEPVPGDENDFPLGDVHHGENPEKSLDYSSDFVPLKPRTDLLLSGSCHTPGGAPLQVCPVRFQVGSWSKELTVIGNRVRQKGLVRYSLPEPDPFSKMELRYENAYGGTANRENPSGTGAEKETLPDGTTVIRMANLEYPGNVLRSASGKPKTAGFGPLHPSWSQRTPSGTYDEAWLKKRWPWFPKDFDWNHFNSAPLDQRLENPLRGDEEIAFENMHPEHALLKCRLPGIRPKYFVLQRWKEKDTWHEVNLSLDTLWVCPDREKLVLVWRGTVPVRTLKLDELQEVHLEQNRVGAPALTLTSFHESISERTAEQEEAKALEAEAEQAEERAFDAEIERVKKEGAEGRAQAESASAQIDAVEARGYPEATSVPGAKPLDAEAIRLLKQARDKMQPLKTDPALAWPDSPTDAIRKMNEIRAKAAAENPRLRIDPTPVEIPELGEDDVTWTRKLCEARAREKGSLAGQDLSELDLADLDFSEMDLSGAQLIGANLSGADLVKTNLEGADLTGADLRDIDLTGAILRGADLTGVDLRNGILKEAILDEANLTGARMQETDLEKASAIRTDMDEADLTDAWLVNGNFTQTIFNECILDRANFSGANLTNASVEEARGHDIRMEGANLTGIHAGEAPDFSKGHFVSVIAPDSYWEGAKLDGANFEGADLPRAIFTSASLRNAKMHAADLKNAVFEEADLEGASLDYANLFRGSFERASLRNTDLGYANCYEAEFWDAVLDHTNLLHANLKMTKLAGRS